MSRSCTAAVDIEEAVCASSVFCDKVFLSVDSVTLFVIRLVSVSPTVGWLEKTLWKVVKNHANIDAVDGGEAVVVVVVVTGSVGLDG